MNSLVHSTSRQGQPPPYHVRDPGLGPTEMAEFLHGLDTLPRSWRIGSAECLFASDQKLRAKAALARASAIEIFPSGRLLRWSRPPLGPGSLAEMAARLGFTTLEVPADLTSLKAAIQNGRHYGLTVAVRFSHTASALEAADVAESALRCGAARIIVPAWPPVLSVLRARLGDGRLTASMGSHDAPRAGWLVRSELSVELALPVSLRVLSEMGRRAIEPASYGHGGEEAREVAEQAHR